jgi:glycosyltransferase involved in cell wall biosynthesis
MLSKKKSTLFMKILILSTSERIGGAAVAANRLMRALNKSGQEAKMLVRDKQTDDPNVVSINTNWWKKKINCVRFAYERWVIFLNNRFSRKNLFAVSIANTGTDISRHPLMKEADIIHLHWINQGFLSLTDIRKLIESGKPVVWTMHDMWSFTGICHYTDICEQYKTECIWCPQQAKYFFENLTKRTFSKKKKISLSGLTFVGCSSWITCLSKQSKLFNDVTAISIPNSIDTNIFNPVDKCEARKRLNLPVDKQLLLFVAAKLSDNRKGVTYLVKACHQLRQKKNVINTEIVLIGKCSEELANQFPVPIIELGYISDNETMVLAYSCADLFMIPSLEDNLPNTIMEAMACGTPCVGFNTGGIPEMIDHKQNGYVAEYKNSEDLAAGIEWVLENTEKLRLSDACVKKVKENYSETVVAEKYISLYLDKMQ